MDFRKIISFLMILLMTSDSVSANGTVKEFSEEKKIFLAGLQLDRLVDSSFFSNFLKQNLSDACRQNLISFSTSLKKFELWAVEMLDANAKLPSGILNGNINQYGDFDQCLDVESKKRGIRGKYCLATVQLSFETDDEYLEYLRARFLSNEPYKSELEDKLNFIPKSSESHWGLCVPSACSNVEVSLALKAQLVKALKLPEQSWKVKLNNEMCQVKDELWFEKLDTNTRNALGFLAFIIFLAVGSTIYDSNSAREMQNPWLVSFSLKKNIKQIVSVHTNASDISSIHGIRFLNLIKLVTGHKSMELNFYPMSNRTSMNLSFIGPISHVFRCVYLYTDVFYLLSGLLVTTSFFGRMQRGQKINIGKEILGRYFRFMPPIAALILVATFIFPLLGSGPLWPAIVGGKVELCKENWWYNFLMIQNVLGFDNICMANTHHVATDFTLFVASTFLVIFLFHHPRKGFYLVLILAIASTAARFYIVYSRELVVYITNGAKVSKMLESANFMYIVPPYRFTVYAIGILLGYFLHLFKNRTLSDLQLKLGWIAALGSLVITIAICFRNITYTPFNDAMFAGIGSVTICMFYSWVIFVARLGHKNAFITFLEWRYWKIATNLSYSIYLVQFLVFHYNIGVTRSAVHFSFFGSLIDFNETFVILVVAFFMALLVEYPFINLKKLIFDTKPMEVYSPKNDQNNNEPKLIEKIE